MVTERWFEQDISKPIKVQHCEGVVFTADNLGNKIGVKLYNNGSAYSPGGTANCNVIRSDGVTVNFNGTVSTNNISATLPIDALTVPGMISVVLQSYNGSVVTTVFKGIFTVELSTTSTVVAPSIAVSSLAELDAKKVNKAGDTMTGDLTVPALTVAKDTYPMLYFSNGTSQLGLMMINHNSHNISFREMKSGTHFDAFTLPTANLSQTTDDYYDILTSKSAVTVAQGGTGKTSYSAMMNSFGLCSSNANATTFTFSGLDSISASRYRYGLVLGGDPTTAFVYLMFINVGNDVSFYPLYQASSARTLTGSISGTTLTITGSDTVYGGIRLIWLNY